METQLNTRELSGTVQRSLRARVLGLLGPVTVCVGVAWALFQPYRITLLHPHHQGFWWLLVEPPLLVVAGALFFDRVIARPLLDDLEGRDGTQG